MIIQPLEEREKEEEEGTATSERAAIFDMTSFDVSRGNRTHERAQAMEVRTRAKRKNSVRILRGEKKGREPKEERYTSSRETDASVILSGLCLDLVPFPSRDESFHSYRTRTVAFCLSDKILSRSNRPPTAY